VGSKSSARFNVLPMKLTSRSAFLSTWFSVLCIKAATAITILNSQHQDVQQVNIFNFNIIGQVEHGNTGPSDDEIEEGKMEAMFQFALMNNHTTEPEQMLYQLKEARKLGGPRVMDMINAFRAEICAKLHKRWDQDFKTYKNCWDFMKKACNPGKDRLMDGDPGEISSGKGFCEEYFFDLEPTTTTTTTTTTPTTTTTTTMTTTPAPTTSRDGEAAKGPGSAPAPAPAAGAAGETGDEAAPAGASGTTVDPNALVHPSAPEGPESELWYNFPASDTSRMHMKAWAKLPEQGYHGDLVKHEDQETQTKDWTKEFGSKAVGSAWKICQENPDSTWCKNGGVLNHIQEICKMHPESRWCQNRNQPLTHAFHSGSSFMGISMVAKVMFMGAMAFQLV